MAARAVVLLLLAFLVPRASAADVTSCDQQIPAGTVGTLQSDLDCSGSGACSNAAPCSTDADCSGGFCVYSGDHGLTLGDRATLQLNGHTLTNGAVLCSRSCAVAGPGTLSGGFGIQALLNLRVDGPLDVQGGTVFALGRGTLSDLTVSGAIGNFGIEIEGILRATNVTSNGNRIGIVADQKLVGQNITTNDNAYVGIVAAAKLRVTGLTASGNGFDPSNGRGGIIDAAERGPARLVDSTVTGNFYKGTTPLDLFTTNMPRLVRSTCDHSAVLQGTNNPTSSWGVCAQD